MGWLQRLFGGGARASSPADPHGLYVYVRCSKCAEAVKVRINLSNDLSELMADDDSDRIVGYAAEKGVVGSNFMCGQTMRLYLTFDRSRRLTDKRVEGGAFISEDEYRTSESPAGQKDAS